MNPSQLLSQRAAAREYSIDEDELKAAREDGRIPWRRRGRACQMRRADIEAYIASTLTGAPTTTATVPVTSEEEEEGWVLKIIQEKIPNYRRTA